MKTQERYTFYIFLQNIRIKLSTINIVLHIKHDTTLMFRPVTTESFVSFNFKLSIWESFVDFSFREQANINVTTNQLQLIRLFWQFASDNGFFPRSIYNYIYATFINNSIKYFLVIVWFSPSFNCHHPFCWRYAILLEKRLQYRYFPLHFANFLIFFFFFCFYFLFLFFNFQLIWIFPVFCSWPHTCESNTLGLRTFAPGSRRSLTNICVINGDRSL